MKIKSRNGFSFAEMLVTISLIAILSAIAIPGFNVLCQRSKQQLLSTQLMRAIHMARSEALARREQITFRWQQGWTIATADKIIYPFPVVKVDGVLHWRSFPLDRPQLDFLPSGLLNAENGTFWFCSPHAKQSEWAIVLNQAGRARFTQEIKNQLGC